MSNILLQAGKLAIEMHPHLEVFEKKIYGYSEAYTNVDVKVEQEITNAITQQYPESLCIGEETIGTHSENNNLIDMLNNNVFMIDPIDGTNNFINGLPTWAISIGHIVNAEFIGGAIALPILGEMLITNDDTVYASFNQCAFSQYEDVTLSEFSLAPLQNKKFQCYATANIMRAYLLASPYKFHIVRSSVYGVAKVLTSCYFAYIGNAKIWDYAACIGLFRTLGLEVYYYDSEKKQILTLPWKITEEHWKNNYTTSRYPLIFAHSYEHATRTVPLEN